MGVTETVAHRQSKPSKIGGFQPALHFHAPPLAQTLHFWHYGRMRHSTDKVAIPPVGQRVQEIREDRGLTQQQLADRLAKLGWLKPSEVLVYKIQAGIRRVDYHEMAILAQALQCSVADFFERTARKRVK